MTQTNHPTTPPSLKEILFNFLENTPTLIQFEIAKAKITRQKFNALVKEGFSEDQALKIVIEGELR